MHAYLVARGIVDRINRWENDMLARYVPYKYEKDKPPARLQVSMRPIRLYEVVYPEEEHDNVMSMIWPNKTDAPGPLVSMVRRILKFGKPKPWKKNKILICHRNDVRVEYIGSKKDKRNKDGIELL